jgi:hypothetical protein
VSTSENGCITPLRLQPLFSHEDPSGSSIMLQTFTHSGDSMDLRCDARGSRHLLPHDTKTGKQGERERIPGSWTSNQGSSTRREPKACSLGTPQKALTGHLGSKGCQIDHPFIFVRKYKAK